MKITAICHTCHRPSDLADAVENFRQQAYPNKRMIVFDDGGTLHDSDDGLVKIVSSHHRSTAAYSHMVRLAATSNANIVALWETSHLMHPSYLATLAKVFMDTFSVKEAKQWTRVDRTDLGAFWASDLFNWSTELFACKDDADWKAKVFELAKAYYPKGTILANQLATYRGAEPRDTTFVGTLRKGYSELAAKVMGIPTTTTCHSEHSTTIKTTETK